MSRQRHLAINKKATQMDGESFKKGVSHRVGRSSF